MRLWQRLSCFCLDQEDETYHHAQVIQTVHKKSTEDLSVKKRISEHQAVHATLGYVEKCSPKCSRKNHGTPSEIKDANIREFQPATYSNCTGKDNTSSTSMSIIPNTLQEKFDNCAFDSASTIQVQSHNWNCAAVCPLSVGYASDSAIPSTKIDTRNAIGNDRYAAFHEPNPSWIFARLPSKPPSKLLISEYSDFFVLFDWPSYQH